MISIRLNGEKKMVRQNLTLDELVSELSLPTSTIAVAINNNVIPKSAQRDQLIKADDAIEIVHPMGGG